MLIIKNQHRKLITIILLDIIIIIAVIIGFNIIRPHFDENVKINGVFIKTPQELSEFHFTDNHGNPFSKNELKGHWTLMFFGFTRCPMVCPTTMSALNKMYKILQKDLSDSMLPQVVFISVDPDSDTVDKINHYVASFNARFIGARAEVKETVALEKQLSIMVSKVNTAINHSGEILLLNPSAQVQAYFSYPHQPEKMARDYKLIQARSS